MEYNPKPGHFPSRSGKRTNLFRNNNQDRRNISSGNSAQEEICTVCSSEIASGKHGKGDSVREKNMPVVSRIINKGQLKWNNNYNDSNDISSSSSLGQNGESNKCKKCFCCWKSRKRDLFPGWNNASAKNFLSGALIFLLAVGIYWNSLSGDFVHDDVVAIVRNPDVNLARTTTSQFHSFPEKRTNSGGRDREWWSVWRNDYWGMPMSSVLSHKSYRPLTVLTFRLNYWMCGESLCPEVFHATNMLIHGVVTCLLFYLCGGILRMRLSISILASCLFALHPIHTEAVAGITGRADALACLMMLISFILYHGSIIEYSAKCNRNRNHHRKEKATKQFTPEHKAACMPGVEKDVWTDRLTNWELQSEKESLSSATDFHVDQSFSLKLAKSWKQDDNIFKSAVLSSSSLSSPSKESSSLFSIFSAFSKANALLLISGVVGCFSMLAKETGITVLGINLLYDLYIHFGCLTSRENEAKRGKKKIVEKEQRKDLHLEDKAENTTVIINTSKTDDFRLVGGLKQRSAFTLGLIIISLTFRFSLMDGTFPRFGRPDNPAAYANSNVTRLLTFAYLPAFNIILILHPRILSYDWQMGSIPMIESIQDPRNFTSLTFYVLLSLLVLKTLRCKMEKNGTIIMVGLLFISFPFLPASNLLFPVGFVVAERVLYTPSLGMCILFAHGLDILHLFGRKLSHRKPKLVILLVLSACTSLLFLSFGLRTWQRNTVWQSRLSLFTSGIRDVPQNAKMHYNYANLQKDLDDSVTAIEHYSIAIRLWPEYASAHNNLGTLLMGNPAAAEHQFLRAISVGNQAHGGAHFNLGILYMNDDKFAEAATHFKKSMIIDPYHQEAFQYYSICIKKAVENKTIFYRKEIPTPPPQPQESGKRSSKVDIVESTSLNNRAENKEQEGNTLVSSKMQKSSAIFKVSSFPSSTLEFLNASVTGNNVLPKLMSKSFFHFVASPLENSSYWNNCGGNSRNVKFNKYFLNGMIQT